MRLFLISSFIIVAVIPLQIYLLVIQWPAKYVPYSWAQVHDATVWQKIAPIPSNGYVSPERWIYLGCGVAVFVFFGMGRDAISMYCSWLRAVGLGSVVAKFEQKRAAAHDTTGNSLSSRARLFVKSRLWSNTTVSAG